MKINLHRLAIVMVGITMVMAMPFTADAQTRSREYIRQQIREQNSCRNVAITKYNGDLMLYGTNGWAASGCPKDLTDALDELNSKGEYITDVQLTEEGCWLILYGDNGAIWNDIPATLEAKLKEWNKKQEIITSVTFNDMGEWIAVSTNYISASDEDIQDWIVEGMEDFGCVWATCITDDALVVVYEGGFGTSGNIPSTLTKCLKTTDINVYRIKIAGEAWFISDGKREYDYNM